MKILLTHERFLPNFGGGGERVVFETARQLRARGMDVTVLTTGDRRIESYEGVPTVRLPIHRYGFNFAVQQIVSMASDADLIQTFNYHACLPSLVAGRLLKKPVVCTVLGLFHDAWRDLRGPIVGRAFMAWESFLLRRRYARVVFLSEYSRDLGVSLGVNRERSVVISPGIRSAEFRSSVKDDSVLFVGKLERRKGVFEVLEAARSLPDLKFRIVGWGPEEKAVERTAPRNVELTLTLTRERLKELYAGAKVFVLPSRAETFGLVILEAMASGCAVISTVPLEFEGVLLRNGSSSRLVAALKDLFADPERTERLGKRNVALAKQYTWERYTAGLVNEYEGLLASGSAPGENRI